MSTTAKKLLLLGEIGVGKTSLIRRLVHDEWQATDYMATIGVDIYRYEVKGIGRDQRQALQLVIWDLDGSISPSIFTHVYSKGASGALIVGDIKRPTTLELMVKLAHGMQDAMPSRAFSFVVNKVDLIGKPDAHMLPEPLRAPHQPLIWTSALTSENVRPVFKQIADAFIRREN